VQTDLRESSSVVGYQKLFAQSVKPLKAVSPGHLSLFCHALMARHSSGCIEPGSFVLDSCMQLLGNLGV